MTTKDLYDHVPLRTDSGEVSALENGLCGHCGQTNDFHQGSYFCRKCYFWMHKGDTTTLHGLAHDFEDIEKGKVDPRLYHIDPVERPIYNEGKEIIDEKNKKRTV